MRQFIRHRGGLGTGGRSAAVITAATLWNFLASRGAPEATFATCRWRFPAVRTRLTAVAASAGSGASLRPSHQGRETQEAFAAFRHSRLHGGCCGFASDAANCLGQAPRRCRATPASAARSAQRNGLNGGAEAEMPTGIGSRLFGGVQWLSDGFRVVSMLLIAGALVAGGSCGAALAAKDTSSDVEVIDAALGVIQRNYYDQTYNNQDWQSTRANYLKRARRGERAETLTRELVASLGDRYSRVVDADAFAKLMAYDPLGLGVVLNRAESGEVVISNPPFQGSAAAKAGLREGDVVVALDGMALRKESLFKAMNRVAQADAPQVTLSLRRDVRFPSSPTPEPTPSPSSSPTTATTAREWEETLARTRTATQKDLVEAGVTPPRPDGKRVGYLRLRSFGARSAQQISQALASVRAQGADELVLDLRGNTGGSFEASLEVASIFLEPGAVATQVQTPKSIGSQPVRVGESGAGSGGGTPAAANVAREPLVLLVDQGSASASEVLAAALRGNCRAPLLGAKTYGKAAVQGVFGLPNREAIALSVAKYSGPGGTAIGSGLQPDGRGPADGPLALLTGAMGLPSELSPSDYASVDAAATSSSALRSCRPAESW